MKRLVFAALTLALAASLGCAAVARLEGNFDPATKEKLQRCDQFLKYDIAPKEERALGGALAVGMVAHNNGIFFASAKPADGDPLNHYLNEVGRNLAAMSQRPDLPWTFGVLNSPEVNAFSTPGGYVFVSRGLLAKIHSEAALAGVLGHEIGHVVLKHALEKYKHVKVDTCQAAISKGWGNSVKSTVLGAISSSLSDAVGQPHGFIDLDSQTNFEALYKLTDNLEKALDSGFDKNQEYAADQLGLMLAIQAGYNPQPYIDFIGSLPDGGTGVFGDHPPSRSRVEKLDQWPKWLESEGSLVSENDVKRYPTVELDQRMSAATAP